MRRLIESYKILPVAMVVFLSGFTSCVYEDLNDEEISRGEGTRGEVYYLPLDITGLDEDLEGDAIAGDQTEESIAKESLIDPSGLHYAAFFNEDGSFYTLSTFMPGERKEYPEGNVEADHRAIVEVAITRDENGEITYPKYCFVILNGTPVASTLENFKERTTGNTITDFLNLSWGSTSTQPIGYYSAGDGETNYFTMTNTSYLALSGNKYKQEGAGELSDDMLYLTRRAAEAADAKKLSIYVERMVSKFTASFVWSDGREGFFKPTPTNNDYQYSSNQYVTVASFTSMGDLTYSSQPWTAQIIGWDITGLESSNYLFKNLSTTPPATYPVEFNTMPDFFEIKGTTPGVWNDAPNFRSYWSVDPHYTGITYPSQYRHAIDDEELKHYEVYNEKSWQPLDFLSYRQLKESLDGETVVYSPENTFSQTNEFLNASTYLILKAKLLIGDNEEPSDIYRTRQGVYFLSENDYYRAFLIAVNAQLGSHTYMNYSCYDWGENNQKKFIANRTLYLENGSTYMMCIHDGDTDRLLEADDLEFIDAYIHNGDSKILPWNADEDKIFIGKVGSDGSITPVTDLGDTDHTPITSNEIKSMLYEWIGAADHFNGGSMYYAAPIQYRAETIATSSANVKTGDYAAVRNCWYNYTISGVTKPGIPVSVLSDPIVPQQTGAEDGLILKVNLLGWHIVQTDVEFADVSDLIPY